MIFDLERDAPPSIPDRFDVCVVGAGAAGIALTVELTRRGKRVLLLEGGGREIEARAQEPYQAEVIGNTHRGVHSGRFRASGGTTHKWGGQILPLHPEDFVERPWVSGSGWPLSFSALQPAYDRALTLEGLAAVERDDAAVWQGLGEPRPRFDAFDSYLTRWCPEPNFARLHRGVLEGGAVSLWLHANAVELLLEDETVRGLRCRTQTGGEHIFHAEEFVFCLGSIESVRFFLQPRTQSLPWNRSGLLGRHFQDHIDASVARVVPHDRAAFAAAWDNIFLNGYKYHPKIRLSPAVQKREVTLNCGATMSFTSDAEETLVEMKETAKHLLRGRFRQLRAAALLRTAANAPLLLRQSFRYARQHRAFNPADSAIHLRLHCEQEPLSASTITLSEVRDSLGLLRTRLDWRIAASELRTLRLVAERAAVSLAPSAAVEIDADLLSGDPAFIARCDDSNHHMGGMRMHDAPTAGVVSTDLRLHGTRNCFVLSGAVFPCSGFSNPTHTVLALAVRLAAHLSA